jgi:cysteinyl-tRNA synthetase
MTVRRIAAAALSVLGLLATSCAIPDRGLPTPTRLHVGSWAIQLQGLDRPDAIVALTRARTDLLVVDPLPVTTVPRLRAGGRRVLAYLDVGRAETWRSYWSDGWRPAGPEGPGSPSFLLAPAGDGWEGEHPVAFWDEGWRGILMREVDAILAAGHDGLFLDRVDAAEDAAVVAAAHDAGVDPREAMIALVREVAEHARLLRPEAAILLNGGESLVAGRLDLDDVVDGVVAESVSFSGAASQRWDTPGNADVPVPSAVRFRRLSGIRARGLEVLTLDYASEFENLAAAVEAARFHGLVPCVSRTSLDRPPLYPSHDR